jgi:DNA-binding NarL/FixJ family response regulator
MQPTVTQFETRALRLQGPAEEPLRVLVAGPSVLVRAATARVLQETGVEVVGQARERDELLRKARAHRPEVVVLAGASDDARALRAELPRIGVLVLAGEVDAAQARALLEPGAEGVGYLLEHRVAEVDRFVGAVYRVARGGSVLDPEVIGAMVRSRSGSLDALSAREREVLSHMADGRSNRGIADLLFLSERAVERHVSTIFGKLGLPAAEDAHRRVLAVLMHMRAA